MSVPQIIERWGYPVESHEIETEDGYILSVFRIKQGINSSGCAGKESNRPPIIMDHGLLSDSAEYVLNPRESSPAMILADAGFDVFLTNHRGSTYGRKHRDFTTKDWRFWQFTVDDLAKFDDPAAIDFVLKETGQKSLYFLGHSQGAMAVMMMLSERPEYNSKIRALFQITPPGTAQHAGGFWKFALIGYRVVDYLYRLLPFSLNSYEVAFETRGIFGTIGGWFCSHHVFSELCLMGMHIHLGRPTITYNHSRSPVYAAHIPSGTSTWNMLHWGQIATRKKLEHFDEPHVNMERYGQMTPPSYNLSRVDTPIHIFWSSNDLVVTHEDIHENLIPLLKEGIVKGIHNVPEYNHIDFVLATDNAEKVFNRVASIVREQERDMCKL